MGTDSPAKAGISGVLFGAALATSGVFTPAVVLAQMRLEDWHMVKVFLSATAGSALAINLLPSLLPSLSAKRPTARKPTTLNIFSTYDGNILGGLAIGAGMAIAGACPGTVFVQVGAGLRSGLICLTGGIVGAVIYGLTVEKRLQGSSESPDNGKVMGSEDLATDEKTLPNINPASSTVGPVMDTAPTINALLGTSASTTLVGFEAFLVSALAIVHLGLDKPSSVSMSTFSPITSPLTPSGALSPIYGGLLITIAQAGSLLLTESTLGASGVYSDVARWILRHPQSKPKSPSSAQEQNTTTTIIKSSATTLISTNTAFTAGVVLGGYLISQSLPDLAFAAGISTSTIAIGSLRSFLGGAFLAFGARTARGCTSGHGISGLASFGVASALSVGCMFVAGFGIGAFI